MKNIKLHFTTGLFIGLIMSLILYFGYKQLYPGLTELYALLFCSILGLVLGTIIFKGKKVRIGIIIGIFPILIFNISSIIRKLPTREVREFSKNYINQENSNIGEASRREDIIKDTLLNLVDKLRLMKLGKQSLSELADIKIDIFESTEINLKHPNTAVYKQFFNDFKVNYLLFENETNLKKVLSGDSILLKFNNGDSAIFKTDPITYRYIGYLPRQQVFVFEEWVQETGINYFSINSINGQKFNGIPLLANSDLDLFSYVRFSETIGWIDLEIAIWTKLGEDYEQLVMEKIPMGYFADDFNDLPCRIKTLNWNNNDLEFDLELLDHYKVFESVQFKISVKLQE